MPASAIHQEFDGFLSALALPADVAETTVTRIVRALGSQEALAQAALRKRREWLKGLQRRLGELVELRADKLLSDDEFTAARDRLRRQILECQADEFSGAERPLSRTEASDLVVALGDLSARWRCLPPVHRNAFGQFLLPAGYVYQQIQTSELGLLFRAIRPSGQGDPCLVRAEGIEPSTFSTSTRRSTIELSAHPIDNFLAKDFTSVQ